jgi:hypothetical protein
VGAHAKRHRRLDDAGAERQGVLFHAETEEKSTATELLSRTMFSEIDRVDPQIWLIGGIALFVVGLFACVLGTCLYAVVMGG